MMLSINFLTLLSFFIEKELKIEQFMTKLYIEINYKLMNQIFILFLIFLFLMHFLLVLIFKLLHIQVFLLLLHLSYVIK